MVHKFKSFPVGKAGQRQLKKQIVDKEKDSNNQRSSKNPKPVGNADLGAKIPLMYFLSNLGINAHSQIAKKGGRRTRIDPLSLKQVADNLLRDIESKSIANTNQESSSEEEDSYVSDDNSY